MINFRNIEFPDPKCADDDGLVAVGGDLKPDMLIAAYTQGIFPWTSNPYVTWWSPNPRAVFFPSEFKLSSRMERAYRNTKMIFTFDKDFRGVITGCAAPAKGREESWIDDNFIEAYCEMHRLSLAHSCEAWLDGKLVGGVYGIALRRFFAGESMFHKVTNASTFCLNFLMKYLADNGFILFDSQVINPHTKYLGAQEISRDTYLSLLSQALSL
ncbi:MAG: leucyl/phenylalanyl-tRNA--protein transferase [Candidatus Riflebacteria bacterium]|nr:leucyl/phenylalanyl-tRNA--protein transferase [Candidatus Riflebacteria bacterium]